MARYSIGITALVIIGLVFTPVAPFEHAASGQATIGAGLDGFQAWLDLARHHEPGRIDAALKREREIPHSRSASISRSLLQFVRNPKLENRESWSPLFIS